MGSRLGSHYVGKLPNLVDSPCSNFFFFVLSRGPGIGGPGSERERHQLDMFLNTAGSNMEFLALTRN